MMDGGEKRQRERERESDREMKDERIRGRETERGEKRKIGRRKKGEGKREGQINECERETKVVHCSATWTASQSETVSVWLL